MADANYGLALKSAASASDVAGRVDRLARQRYNLPTAPTTAQPLATGPSPAEEGKLKLAEASQQMRFVEGKTFFQNDDQWVDSAIQKAREAPRVRIQFGSKDYFDLTTRNQRITAWLALGQNVQFLLDGKVYEIYSEASSTAK